MNKTILTATVMLFLLPPLVAEDPVLRIAELEARKSVTERVSPTYPAMAKQMHVAGKVQIDVFVNPEGSVEKVNILSGNALLTGAAVNAVKQWKFTPFKANGKDVHAVTSMTFNFSI